MQSIVTRANDMYPWLPKISSETFFFNFGYLPSDTLYLHKKGREDRWLFFEAKMGP